MNKRMTTEGTGPHFSSVDMAPYLFFYYFSYPTQAECRRIIGLSPTYFVFKQSLATLILQRTRQFYRINWPYSHVTSTHRPTVPLTIQILETSPPQK